MSEQTLKQGEGETGRLGPWVWLPVAALALVVLVIFNLPGADCDGVEDGGTDFAEVLLIAVTVVASLGCLGAMVRLAALRNDWARLGIWIGRTGAAVFLISLLIAFGSALHFEFRDLIWPAIFVGTIATGLALFVLICAWAGGRKVDDVGILLSLYLLGAALFVYPTFALVALVLNSGALC